MTFSGEEDDLCRDGGTTGRLLSFSTTAAHRVTWERPPVRIGLLEIYLVVCVPECLGRANHVAPSRSNLGTNEANTDQE